MLLMIAGIVVQRAGVVFDVFRISTALIVVFDSGSWIFVHGSFALIFCRFVLIIHNLKAFNVNI